MDSAVIVKAIHRNLVEFGYGNLTLAEVQASYDKAIAGEKPKGIIDMMTKSQLEANDLI